MKRKGSGHTYQAFELCYTPPRQEIQKAASQYAQEVVPGYGTLYCRNIPAVTVCTVPGHRNQYEKQSRKNSRKETLRFSYRGTGKIPPEQEKNLADFLLGNTSRFLVVSVDSYGMARNFQLSGPVPENQIQKGNTSLWLRSHGISGSPKTIWLRERGQYQNQNGERYVPQAQILLRYYPEHKNPVCLSRFGQSEQIDYEDIRKRLSMMMAHTGKQGNSPFRGRGHFSLEQISTDSDHLILVSQNGTPKQIADFSTGTINLSPEDSAPELQIQELQRYHKVKNGRWVQRDTRPSARETRAQKKKEDENMRHNPPITPKDYQSIRNRKIQFSNTDHPVSVQEAVRPIKEEVFAQAMEVMYPQETQKKSPDKFSRKEQSR